MKLMLGNEAIARGAFEAGCTVSSAYPGTPSTEITEYIAKYDEIYSEWATNEKVSVEVAYGACVAGARSICAMKHVGLNVAADPLFTASYSGVNGGMVIVVADDPGMHSSQNEQDSRNYAIASKTPMLEPADSQECKDYVKQAFELSELYDTPFLVRLTTRTAHSQSIVETCDRTPIKLEEYNKDYTKYVMMPAFARKKHVLVEARNIKLSIMAETSHLNRVEMDSKKIGVIVAGNVYQYVKEALPNASILKLGMVYPMPETLIKDFASKVETLYVIEELDPVIENHVKLLGVKCIGKDVFPIIGELTSAIIREKVLGVENILTKKVNVELPVRPPVLCAGCPHRGLHVGLKGLNIAITGDIGCYTLGALAPTETMDTCICMGASVTMAHGFDKAWKNSDTTKKPVALLGDSTFIHSGITGLINTVYNKGVSTVIIADNSITGMTGHQQNPTTGKTLKGEPTFQIDIEKLVSAIGVKRIRVVDPFDNKALKAAVLEEVSVDEPSVIITRRPCALLKDFKILPALKIDTEKCKRCRRCISTGCPAIEDHNGTIAINESLCVGCGFCMGLCNFSAMSQEGK